MVVDAMCAIAGDSDSCAPMSAVQLDAVGNNYPLRSELSKDSPAPLLNILTRSGNRRLLFEALRESLSRQTYTNIRHIVSNDNSYSTDPYLRPNDGYDVLSVSANRSVPAFYNLYIDTLAAKAVGASASAAEASLPSSRGASGEQRGQEQGHVRNK